MLRDSAEMISDPSNRCDFCQVYISSSCCEQKHRAFRLRYPVCMMLPIPELLICLNCRLHASGRSRSGIVSICPGEKPQHHTGASAACDSAYKSQTVGRCAVGSAAAAGRKQNWTHRGAGAHEGIGAK